MAKCQLLQTLPQVRVLGGNVELMSRWQDAEKTGWAIPSLTAGCDRFIGTFCGHTCCWNHPLFLILLSSRRLVITTHWAGSLFSSWLRNPLPTFGMNLNIFQRDLHRLSRLPVKTPWWGSLNAGILMSLTSSKDGDPERHSAILSQVHPENQNLLVSL